MTAFVLLKLLTAAACLFMAAAILARDPGLRLNRLMGAVLTLTVWWALCEVMWSIQTDPDAAARFVRLSSLGWLTVGSIFFQIFLEVARGTHRRLLRLVPVVYGLAALGIVLYVGTPWCLVDVVPTAWGWGFEFGPLFPLPFFLASVPPTLVVLNWRSVYPSRGSGGERSVSRSAVRGATIAVLVASSTDAILPFLGLQTPPLGSTAIALMSLVIALRLRQYGYSLLSAGAFAQEILAALHDGVVLLHPDGTVRHCNGAFQSLSGRPRGELVGTRIERLLSMAGDDAAGETRRPDGAPSLSGVADGQDGREARLLRPSGESIPVFVSRPVVCRRGDRVAGTAFAVRDLREMNEIRKRLITTARLAAVGDLSVGIAEEIKRPIAAVRSDLGRLQERWGTLAGTLEKDARTADPRAAEILGEGEELIDDCRYGVERIASIASGVRDFAGTGSSERAPTDVRETLDDAIRIAMPRAKGRVRLVRDFEPVPPISCARQEIERVFQNLIVNALQAVEEGGEVEVATLHRDGSVQVRIRDDGAGIEPEHLERIFDPFFTTKPVGEGTGLGLAISYHVVRNHGGEIRIATRSQDGTTFTVELPASGDR